MIAHEPNYDTTVAMKAAAGAKYNLTEARPDVRQESIMTVARIVGPSRAQAYLQYLAAGARKRIHARTQVDLAYIEDKWEFLTGQYLEACGIRGKAALKTAGYQTMASPWVRKMAIYNAIRQGMTPDGLIHCISQKIKTHTPGSGPARRLHSDLRYIRDNQEDLEDRVLKDMKMKALSGDI